MDGRSDRYQDREMRKDHRRGDSNLDVNLLGQRRPGDVDVKVDAGAERQVVTRI
jgi:hypothetical protein